MGSQCILAILNDPLLYHMRSWRGFRNQNKNKVLWYKDKPNYYIAAKTLFSGNTFATDAGSVTIIRFEVIHDPFHAKRWTAQNSRPLQTRPFKFQTTQFFRLRIQNNLEMIITALANDEKPLIYVKIINSVRFGKFTRRPAIYKIHNTQKHLRKINRMQHYKWVFMIQ